ncbi:MAG: MFS transporter [Candidatus Hodarchaeales archaeon]|jgi:DHA3 family macrolide efflux protein-like MFS transporter
MSINTQSNLRGYLIIWLGQLISLFGSGVVQFAIIWWITTETGSTLFLALASFAGLVPLVIFTPLSGVLADRWNRKYLILGTDFLQALLTLLLIILFSFNVIGTYVIIVMLFFRGMLQALQLPATVALVPQMVPKKNITRINGLNSIFNNVIYILTPIIGALLLEVGSIEVILWIDLITFLIAAGSILITKIPYYAKKVSKDAQIAIKSSFKKEFLEGLTYLRSNGFMTIIIGGMLANILINPLFTLLPHFIKHVHLGEALELAFVLGFFQMGSLIGGLFIMLKNFQPRFGNLIFAIFTAFCGLFLIGITPVGFFPFLILGSLIAGISIGTVDIMIMTILQVNIPTELQGRVFSILFMLVKSILPLAILITGSFAEILGISIIYLISPILGFALVFYLTFGQKSTAFDRNLTKKDDYLVQVG